MKLLVDHNLSPELSARLQDLFPCSLHISDVLTRRTKDPRIWSYARENGFVIVTKDSQADFRRLNRERGYPPKVIWIRTGNNSNAEVEALICDNYGEILAFEQDPNRGIIELR